MFYHIFKETKMKNKFSVCVLCALLIGFTALVTSCGSRVRASQVYEVANAHLVKKYWCFHSNGRLYVAAKTGEKLTAISIGTYEITNDTIRITAGDTSKGLSSTLAIPYTLEGATLQFTYEEEKLTMIKVDEPTEQKILEAAKGK